MQKQRMKRGGDVDMIKKNYKKVLQKKVDAKKNPGLAKLPQKVRNKMGF